MGRGRSGCPQRTSEIREPRVSFTSAGMIGFQPDLACTGSVRDMGDKRPQPRLIIATSHVIVAGNIDGRTGALRDVNGISRTERRSVGTPRIVSPPRLESRGTWSRTHVLLRASVGRKGRPLGEMTDFPHAVGGCGICQACNNHDAKTKNPRPTFHLNFPLR
jgi:hypothetical protein